MDPSGGQPGGRPTGGVISELQRRTDTPPEAAPAQPQAPRVPFPGGESHRWSDLELPADAHRPEADRSDAPERSGPGTPRTDDDRTPGDTPRDDAPDDRPGTPDDRDAPETRRPGDRDDGPRTEDDRTPDDGTDPLPADHRTDGDPAPDDPAGEDTTPDRPIADRRTPDDPADDADAPDETGPEPDDAPEKPARPDAPDPDADDRDGSRDSGVEDTPDPAPLDSDTPASPGTADATSAPGDALDAGSPGGVDGLGGAGLGTLGAAGGLDASGDLATPLDPGSPGGPEAGFAAPGTSERDAWPDGLAGAQGQGPDGLAGIRDAGAGDLPGAQGPGPGGLAGVRDAGAQGRGPGDLAGMRDSGAWDPSARDAARRAADRNADRGPDARADDRAVRRAREAAEAGGTVDAAPAADARPPLCVPEPAPYVNYGRDGIGRKDAYIDAAKRADEALRIGVPYAPFEADLVGAYADRLRDQAAPVVRDEVAGLAGEIGATGHGVDVADSDEIVSHVGDMAAGRRPGYQVGDMTHAVRARIEVADPALLPAAVSAAERRLGTGDQGRILEIRPDAVEVPLTVAAEAGGRRYAYELLLTAAR
ncbi:MAG TPA: hypothetical protein VGL93_05840 [Streptosporangiaceae bacterium]|jgi:hypothetical protein